MEGPTPERALAIQFQKLYTLILLNSWPKTFKYVLLAMLISDKDFCKTNCTACMHASYHTAICLIKFFVPLIKYNRFDIDMN